MPEKFKYDFEGFGQVWMLDNHGGEEGRSSVAVYQHQQHDAGIDHSHLDRKLLDDANLFSGGCECLYPCKLIGLKNLFCHINRAH